MDCKKVLFVIGTLRDGGAERVLSNISLALPKEWEIDILLNDKELVQYPYRGNLISMDIKPPDDMQELGYQFRVFIKRIRYLRKLKRNRKYDACISFMDSANIVNVLTANKECKTILTAHSTLSKNVAESLKYRFIVSPLVKLLYNRAYKVVAVSKGVERDLINEYHIKKDIVVTIYNGFDVESIVKSSCLEPDDWQMFCGKFTIVTMGRLDGAKGQWNLIKAFAKVHDHFLNTQLLILGDGSLRGYLEELAEKYGVSDAVLFKGFVDNPFRYLKCCQLFVLPSIFEGFPCALIEAMACGMPIISADFQSGARETLAPRTPISYINEDRIEYAEYGVMIPVGDEQKSADMFGHKDNLLVEAIEKMILDDELRTRYSQKSIMRAKDFSIDEIMRLWLELLE